MSRLAALFRRLGPDPRADGALIHAFLRDRDEAAFAELVRRHGPTVWGVCRRTLPDPADAEDAFQATFLVLVKRAGGLDPAGCVAGWLYRVAVLTSRGLRRRNARRRTVPLPDLPARPDPPPVDVDALLMRLPERERAAVVLCHLHGLTQREAADRLGVPEGTVSARLSRGLAKLRRAVGFNPAALAAVAVPAAVAEAAVTVATAGRAAGPGVGLLVTEVLRMLWLKKLATAGLAVVAVGGFGVGLGVAVRSGPAAAQPPGNPRPPAEPAPARPESDPDAELRRLADALKTQADTLTAESKTAPDPATRERKRVAGWQLSNDVRLIQDVISYKPVVRAEQVAVTVNGPLVPRAAGMPPGPPVPASHPFDVHVASGEAFDLYSEDAYWKLYAVLDQVVRQAKPKLPVLTLNVGEGVEPHRLKAVYLICRKAGFSRATVNGKEQDLATP
jgi:DNA-directed RNA polymerase specialized sigma24 family protein